MTAELPIFMEVVAGVLADAEGRVLLAARPAGKAFAGRWEFPGGKVDLGELPERALVRELMEELGVVAGVEDCQKFLTVTHRYPGADRGVRITAYRVRNYRGVAQGREGQSLAWHFCRDLPQVDILEADRPIVTALRLGESIDLTRLSSDAQVHVGLASFRPADSTSQMAGVILDFASEADAAQRAGADFIFLVRAPTPEEIEMLLQIGLPWYVRSPQIQAGANGIWRGSY